MDRSRVFRWISSIMYDYLLDNVGLYPSFTDRLRRLNLGDLLIDFYPPDDLNDWISDDLGEDIDLDNYRAEVVEGSKDGILRWVYRNIQEFCYREKAQSAAFATVHAGSEGIRYILIVEGGEVPKSDLVAALRDMGYGVDSSSVWIYDRNTSYEHLYLKQREGLEDFFTALKAWRDIEVYDLQDLE